jgi:hypothetical protein
MLLGCRVALIGGPCLAAYLACFSAPDPNPRLCPLQSFGLSFLLYLQHSISARHAATRPGQCHTTRRRGGRLESRFLNVAFALYTHVHSLRKPDD